MIRQRGLTRVLVCHEMWTWIWKYRLLKQMNHFRALGSSQNLSSYQYFRKCEWKKLKKFYKILINNAIMHFFTYFTLNSISCSIIQSVYNSEKKKEKIEKNRIVIHWTHSTLYSASKGTEKKHVTIKSKRHIYF